MTQLIILDQVVTLEHHADGRSATLYALEGESRRQLGVLGYNTNLDAYTSNLDRDPRSLADQLELLVRYDKRRKS